MLYTNPAKTIVADAVFYNDRTSGVLYQMYRVHANLGNGEIAATRLCTDKIVGVSARTINGTNTTIRYSLDGGASWNEIETGFISTLCMSIGIIWAPNNSNVIFDAWDDSISSRFNIRQSTNSSLCPAGAPSGLCQTPSWNITADVNTALTIYDNTICP